MFPDIVITIFGQKLPLYTLFWNAGFIVSLLYAYWYLTKTESRRWLIIVFLVTLFLVKTYGSTVLPKMYKSSLAPQLAAFEAWAGEAGRLTHSALMWFARTIGHLAWLGYAILYARIARWRIGKIIDMSIICGFITSSIGRLGCLAQGCCRGKPLDAFWAITLPGHPSPRHPTQIYMLICEVALTVALIIFDRKMKRYDGQTAWIALLLYSAYRFSLEFFRTNIPFIGGLTHAQWLAIPAFAVALYKLCWRDRRAP